jgi:hypothetical protein
MIAMNGLFYELLKAPTRIGRLTLDEIEGFRLYLSVAEEDRLNLLHPPDETPELFEKFLPYAMALDVENQWGERFAGCSPRSGTSLAGMRAGIGIACIRAHLPQVWDRACSQPCPRPPPRRAAPRAWAEGVPPAAEGVAAAVVMGGDPGDQGCSAQKSRRAWMSGGFSSAARHQQGPARLNRPCAFEACSAGVL